MKFFSVIAAAIAVASIAAAPATAADTTTFNSTPTKGFHYGTSNDYSPANAAVQTTYNGLGNPTGELDLRAHVYQQPASASDGSGVYSFALGSNVSFDWGIDGISTTNASAPFNQASALITLTNLLTNQTVSYNPFFPGNDNYYGNGTAQNSARLSFAFLSGLGFDPNVDDTYKINLSIADGNATKAGLTHSLDIYAKLGNGVGAVPEPATWAMMLVGFGAVGFSMRKKRAATFASAV